MIACSPGSALSNDARVHTCGSLVATRRRRGLFVSQLELAAMIGPSLRLKRYTQPRTDVFRSVVAFFLSAAGSTHYEFEYNVLWL